MITSLIVVDLVYNMKLMEDCVAYVVIPGDKAQEHTKHLVVYMQQESLANLIGRLVNISVEFEYCTKANKVTNRVSSYNLLMYFRAHIFL